MEYEYNGYMTFEERIANVTKDIIKKYPSIEKKVAINVARVESPIIDPKNEKIEFNRLYQILYRIEKETDLYRTILNDIKKVYSKIIKKEGYNNSLEDRLMNEIINFENKIRSDFPKITEVY